MSLRAIKKSCCCELPCARDSFFEEGNIPTIITSEYEDQCGCRTCCSYPNGAYVIILAQLLTFTGFASTLVAAADCRFIDGPSDWIDDFSIQYLFNDTIPDNVENNNSTTRGLGFFAWEIMDGTCSFGYYPGFDHETVQGGEEIYIDSSVFELYYTVLVGTDWERARTMAGITAIVSLFVLIWMFSLSCMANKRRYRAVLSFLLTIVLPLFQSLSFLVFRTKFCHDHECQLSDESWRAIGAAIVYFFAGVLLCVGTTNFPGNPYTKGRHPQRCNNLLCCRNTCLQIVRDEEEDPEQMEMVDIGSRVNQQLDVLEVPVESDYFDTSLIDGTVIPATPAPMEISVASLTTTTTTTPPANGSAVSNNSKSL